MSRKTQAAPRTIATGEAGQVDAVSRHREKVLAHAEAQLALQGKESPAELLALYKRFLKIENHRLRLKHHAGEGGREIAHQRASLVDIVLRHLFDGAASRAGEVSLKELSLLAIGGYGRDELNPFSDVDIMFLHSSKAKEVPAGLNEVIQMILYMLWDIGFKVGHSTRSIAGAIKQANIDMLSKTSLLESRHVAGSPELFDEFRQEFVKRCVQGHEKEYILQRVENQNERHAKLGGSIYMQEPNVKNGCGGMRDYQNLLWISFFKEGISSTAELVQKKLLPEVERRRLERAYDFLLRVRTELHYLNKRGTDVLSLGFQGQVANNFQYPQKNILRRTEAFMRDYYQHARNIYNITEMLADRMARGLVEPKAHGAAESLREREENGRALRRVLCGRGLDLRGFPGGIHPGPLPDDAGLPARAAAASAALPGVAAIDPPQAAAGGAYVSILAGGPGDLSGDPFEKRRGGPCAADDALGGLPREVHPRVRRADLPGAA